MKINNINQQPQFKGALKVTGSAPEKRELAKLMVGMAPKFKVNFDMVQFQAKAPAEIFTSLGDTLRLQTFNRNAQQKNIIVGTTEYKNIFDKKSNAIFPQIQTEKARDVIHAISIGMFDFEKMAIKR